MHVNNHTPEECPACFAVIDASVQAPGQRTRPVPKPLDLSICCYCGATLRFGEDMSLRLATEDDLEELTPSQLDLLTRAKRLIQQSHGTQRL